jgi:hypothetical protein
MCLRLRIMQISCDQKNLQSTNDRDVEHPTFALDHVPSVVGILDRVKELPPNV